GEPERVARPVAAAERPRHCAVPRPSGHRARPRRRGARLAGRRRTRVGRRRDGHVHRGYGGRVKAIDVERVRAETPGCEERLHFNNAGASLMPRPVIDTVVAHLELETRIGGYEAKDAAKADLDHVYDSAARLINCSPDEVALLENATRAWYAVF